MEHKFIHKVFSQSYLFWGIIPDMKMNSFGSHLYVFTSFTKRMSVHKNGTHGLVSKLLCQILHNMSKVSCGKWNLKKDQNRNVTPGLEQVNSLAMEASSDDGLIMNIFMTVLKRHDTNVNTKVTDIFLWVCKEINFCVLLAEKCDMYTVYGVLSVRRVDFSVCVRAILSR